MRELKFRVWNGMEMIHDVTVGKFGTFYVNPGDKGNGLDPKDSASLTPFNTKYHDGTPVMQFTGLKDKHGKEIYEGDIVRTYMGNICSINWGFVSEKTIKYDYEYTGFCFHHIDQNRNYHLDVTSSCEVIGNIFQRPELLSPHKP